MISKPIFSISMIFICLMTLTLAFISGPVTFSAHELLSAITNPGHTAGYQILFHLRLPQILNAFIAGGLLALAGCLLQVLLQNPLADPYLLGISSGASVGVLLVMLIGVTTHYWLHAAAFSGALSVMVIVFYLARIRGNLPTLRLLLVGIMIGSVCTSFIALLLTLSPTHQLTSMMYWLIGDITYSISYPLFEGAILFIGLLISLFFSRELNLLASGELRAKSLGVNTAALRYTLYFLSSLLTATAVSLVGCIGFVGLIIPHGVRFMIGSNHQLVLPFSVLLGGCLLTLADTLARTLLPLQQLPVGIITSLIGIPCFLALIYHNKLEH
jgi:iron complex transport system permease protein